MQINLVILYVKSVEKEIIGNLVWIDQLQLIIATICGRLFIKLEDPSRFTVPVERMCRFQKNGFVFFQTQYKRKIAQY